MSKFSLYEELDQVNDRRLLADKNEKKEEVKVRQIKFNDGIYYSFDTYAKRLQLKYNKQLAELENFNEK